MCWIVQHPESWDGESTLWDEESVLPKPKPPSPAPAAAATVDAAEAADADGGAADTNDDDDDDDAGGVTEAGDVANPTPTTEAGDKE